MPSAWRGAMWSPQMIDMDVSPYPALGAGPCGRVWRGSMASVWRGSVASVWRGNSTLPMLHNSSGSIAAVTRTAPHHALASHRSGPTHCFSLRTYPVLNSASQRQIRARRGQDLSSMFFHPYGGTLDPCKASPRANRSRGLTRNIGTPLARRLSPSASSSPTSTPSTSAAEPHPRVRHGCRRLRVRTRAPPSPRSCRTALPKRSVKSAVPGKSKSADVVAHVPSPKRAHS